MDFLIIFIIIIGFIGVFFFLNSKFFASKQDDSTQKIFLDVIENLRREVRENSENFRKEISDLTEKSRKETQEKLDKINEQFVKNLTENQITIQRQFSESSNIIKSVTEKLTKLDETNKQVLNFSEKLESLENILKNPKKRGILGEYFLETLLSNFFAPDQYKIQYKFKNGEIVDAVIFYNKQIIPIDSKFSLEKYNLIQEEKDEEKRKILQSEFSKDIKNRIDETSKYIRPAEDTTDFAFMFIPAEGIYYSLLNYKTGGEGKNMIEYAFGKRVIITSPSSFFAYIQTVIQGLKMLKLQDDLKDVLYRALEMEKHLKSFDEYFKKLGNQIGTVVNTYNQSSKEFGKVDKDILKLSDGKFGGNVEILQIEKPEE
ncbi:MAG: DNA recombination protein RmuC [Patescibacteria group bacterium]